MKSSGVISPFDELQSVLGTFNETSSRDKLNCLSKCSLVKLTSPKIIKRYHDQLLFILAYCEDQALLRVASEEMNRLCDSVIHLGDEKREYLSNSGIAFSKIQGTYSFTLMQWMVQQFPEDVSIHSFDDAGVHPKELLKHRLNEMEFEFIGDESLSKLKWLQKVSGFKKSKDLLNWLLQEIALLPYDIMAKEQLFESMKLYIRVNSLNTRFSRSFGGIHIQKRYFHDAGLLKKFDEKALISKKLPKEKDLSLEEKKEVLNTARIALALLNRETDPVSYGEATGLKMYELEHGLSIALFSIQPKLRLPIESYIGFMMYKNGYPMSYGGAWLFGKRSLIGINIFEAFRGGESAFVFAQLLRTYSQAFGATQFEVEPYQFGKNNPEGLRSGAFWFYHRFGFRPMDDKLFALAEIEHQKILNTKGYRTPIETLKQFTKSNLSVNFKKEEPLVKPLQISHYITHTIANLFKGNRDKAFSYSKSILKKELNLSSLKANEEYGFKKLSVFAALCLNLHKMTAAEKKSLSEVIKLKGTDEFEYILRFHSFPFQKHLKKEVLEFKVS